MTFPVQRPRRLRRSEALRGLVRETRLTAAGLIYPMFVCPGSKVRQEVGSMPGVHQLSVDEAVAEAAGARADGVPAVLLFGLPAHKDAAGSEAADPDAPVQAAVLISTFLTCAGAGFGTVTLSTPFEMVALMASGSVPAGSSSVREKEP